MATVRITKVRKKGSKGNRNRPASGTAKPPKGKAVKAPVTPPAGVGRGYSAGANILGDRPASKAIAKAKCVTTMVTSAGSVMGRITLKSGATVSKTALVRWAGYNGHTKDDARGMLIALGMDGTEGMLSQQYGAGKAYARDGTLRSFVPKEEPIPDISDADHKWLVGLVAKG